MTTPPSPRLPRILTSIAILGALAGASIATAGAASAADNPVICPATNPDTGFSDPTCGPFVFSSSGGDAGWPRTGDVTATAYSQWNAPLWTGTYSISARANLYRTGVDAAAPYVQTVVTFASSSVFGFHGCAETIAKDKANSTRYDSGIQRVGVDGGSSYTLTYGTYLSIATAAGIATLTVTTWMC